MGLYNLKSGVADDTDIVRKIVYTSTAGAVAIQNSTVLIYGGSGTALTLGVPTTAQNGTVIHFVATTAQAHTVTAGTIGFNAGNAGADVGTFGGAIGDGMTVVAYEGEWYVRSNINVTLA